MWLAGDNGMFCRWGRSIELVKMPCSWPALLGYAMVCCCFVDGSSDIFLALYIVVLLVCLVIFMVCFLRIRIEFE